MFSGVFVIVIGSEQMGLYGRMCVIVGGVFCVSWRGTSRQQLQRPQGKDLLGWWRHTTFLCVEPGGDGIEQQ